MWPTGETTVTDPPHSLTVLPRIHPPDSHLFLLWNLSVTHNTQLVTLSPNVPFVLLARGDSPLTLTPLSGLSPDPVPSIWVRHDPALNLDSPRTLYLGSPRTPPPSIRALPGLCPLHLGSLDPAPLLSGLSLDPFLLYLGSPRT